MPTMTLDTHEVVKELKAAGFTDEQPEAATRVVRRAQDVDLLNLATKTDLAETTAEILKGMVSTLGVHTVVIVGAVVTLVRLLHQ
jgi:hypothetical protein